MLSDSVCWRLNGGAGVLDQLKETLAQGCLASRIEYFNDLLARLDLLSERSGWNRNQVVDALIGACSRNGKNRKRALANIMVSCKPLPAIAQDASQMLVLEPRQSNDEDIQYCDEQQRQ